MEFHPFLDEIERVCLCNVLIAVSVAKELEWCFQKKTLNGWSGWVSAEKISLLLPEMDMHTACGR
jgi:hypothetical protein